MLNKIIRGASEVGGDLLLSSSKLKCKSNRNNWVNLQPGNVTIDLLLLRLDLALHHRIGYRPARTSRGVAHVSSQVERHVGRPLENKPRLHGHAEMLAATRNQIAIADHKHRRHRVEVGLAVTRNRIRGIAHVSRPTQREGSTSGNRSVCLHLVVVVGQHTRTEVKPYSKREPVVECLDRLEGYLPIVGNRIVGEVLAVARDVESAPYIRVRRSRGCHSRSRAEGRGLDSH